MNKSEIIKVLIFGSCVSRDSFGHPIDTAAGFEVADYYARSSLASLSAKPVSTKVDLSAIESPFQKRMVERDLTKHFLTHIKEIDFDVLLVDFIDDRLNLFMFHDGSGLTDSPEFRKCNFDLMQHDCRKIAPFSEEFISLWDSGWETLKELLRETNMLDKLLINKVFWASHDDSGLAFENDKYINDANKYLDLTYRKLEQELPSDQFIDYQDIDLIGSSEHQWGRSPFHYTNLFYARSRAAIKRFHSKFLTPN